MKKPRRLLLNRDQARRSLGDISLSTLHRLERRGTLTPIRLTQRETGKVFYSKTEIDALADPANA